MLNFTIKNETQKKKTCNKCGEHKWLREFYKLHNRKDRPDGYDCRCKECRRAERREYYRKNQKVPDGIKLNHEGRVVNKLGASSRLHWGELKMQDFKQRFPYERNEDLAVYFECSTKTIIRRARELGLEKDPHWLANVWDANRKKAHLYNRVFGNKADLTNFIEGGKAHRFQPGHGNNKTKEERSEIMKRAWQTRRKKKAHALASVAGSSRITIIQSDISANTQ